jgi:O-antigen ligase
MMPIIAPSLRLAALACLGIGLCLHTLFDIADIFLLLTLPLMIAGVFVSPDQAEPLSPLQKLYLYVALTLVVWMVLIFAIKGGIPAQLESAVPPLLGAGLAWFVTRHAIPDASRQTLYLIGLLGIIAVLTVTVSILQFLDLYPSDATRRSHGNTNAILFSQILTASGGAALIWATLRHRLRPSLGVLIGIIVALLLWIAANAFTGTRGTMLAMIPFVIWTCVSLAKTWGYRKLAWLLVLVAIIGLVFAAGFLPRGRLFIKEAQALFSGGAVENIRAQLWSFSLARIGESPIFGQGLFPLSALYPEGSPEIWFKHIHAHNQSLDFAVKAGIPAAALVLMLQIIGVLRGCVLLKHPSHPELGYVLIWISSCFFIFGLTNVVLNHSDSGLFFSFFTAALVFSHRPHETEKQSGDDIWSAKARP